MTIVCNPDQLHVKLDPQGNSKRPYVTTCEHTFYHRDHAVMLRVRSGYRTDLTSWLRHLGCLLLISLPMQLVTESWIWVIAGVAVFALILRDPSGRCQLGALAHDAAYEWGFGKQIADKFYLEIMDGSGVHYARKYANYWAVKYFGGPAYWRHRLWDFQKWRENRKKRGRG